MKNNRQIQLVRKSEYPWPIPELASDFDLANWLGIRLKHLYWLADVGKQPVLSKHYRCHWIRKRVGFRLIESPKPLLKQVQRQILDQILCHVPAAESSGRVC